MRRESLPPIYLALLSPTIAELLSSSSPPLEFFNPLGFLMLIALYGFGAILIREYVVRRGYPKSSIILLGVVYGMVEEGFAVKSFFNPGWQDLGILGVYGRYIGVNWVWSIGLTLYHSIISISIPIAIIELVYSDLMDKPWIVSRRGLLMLFSVFVLDNVLINILLVSGYQPSLLHYLILFMIMFLLVWLCGKVNIRPIRLANNPFLMWVGGFLWMLGFYIVLFGLPNLGLPVFIDIIILIIFFYISVRMFSNLFNDELSNKVRMAFALGPPSLFIFLSPLFEFSSDRSDNPIGMTLVGVFFAILFIYVYYKKVGE